MNPTLSSVVRIEKARTAPLLDHSFFGILLFPLGARARNSIAILATVRLHGLDRFANTEQTGVALLQPRAC